MPFDEPLVSQPIVPGLFDIAASTADAPAFLGDDHPLRSKPEGFWDARGAAFREHNLAVSAWRAATQEAPDNSPDEQWLKDTSGGWDLMKNTPLEQYAGRFATARNAEYFLHLRSKIVDEEADRQTLAGLPVWQQLIWGLAAGAASPEILVPGVDIYRGARGVMILANTARQAAAFGALGAGYEAGMQATHELRTAEESAVVIGGSVLLGGLLGGVAGSLARSELRAAVRAIDSEVAGPPSTFREALAEGRALTPEEIAQAQRAYSPIERDLASAGAEAVRPLSIDELTISPGFMSTASAAARATQWLNPNLRLAHASAPEARQIAAELSNLPLELQVHAEGGTLRPAAELAAQAWRGKGTEAIRELQEQFTLHRRSGGALNEREFYDEVGTVMRRGDKTEDAAIAAAAKAVRRVLNEVLAQAQEVKIVPKDIQLTTAESYFPRRYNRLALIRDEATFKSTVAKFYGEHRIPGWRARAQREINEMKNAEARAEAQRKFDAEFQDPRSLAQEIADEIWNKLTGRATDPDARVTTDGWVTINARGSLAERTFDVPDELIEPWLINDARHVLEQVTRGAGADIEIARLFGRADLKDQLGTINRAYDRLRAEAPTAEARAKLFKEERDVIDDLRSLRDLIRGTFNEAGELSNFARIVRGVLQFNYIRMMGGVTLSSLPEAARLGMVHGLKAFMEPAMLSLRGLEGIKLSAHELRLSGAAGETILGGKIAQLTDIYGARLNPNHNAVERFMDRMTEAASTWNGIRIWTDWSKTFAGVFVQNNLLRLSKGFASASTKDRRYLAFVQIDESMAGRIASQFDEFGDTVKGVMVANTERWTDQTAARYYRAAVFKDVSSIAVHRSVGDIPVFANEPIGRMLLQFQTFNLASHQAILLRGLQGAPALFVGGLVAMTSIGMFQTLLRARLGNREVPDFTEHPGWWLGEGLDYSGVAMLPMQLANIMERLIGVNPIKGPLTAADAPSSMRMRDRNRLGAIAGPTGGTFEDIGEVFTIPKTLATGEPITRGQQGAIERLIPFSSYLGMRQFLRYILFPEQPRNPWGK
jgi:hypothetical protein